MDELEIAYRIAEEAHKGQVGKDGLPYILHPMKVAEGVGTDFEKTVAILHDVLEDSDFTPESLLQRGISVEVVECLKLLTKKKGEDYFDYITRICTNSIAIKVKLSDLAHNLDRTRLKIVTEKDLQRIQKYKKAKEILLGYEKGST